MPRTAEAYPTREEVLAYLAAYERRYDLPVERPVPVAGVRRHGGLLRVSTDRGELLARAVVSATGSWASPA